MRPTTLSYIRETHLRRSTFHGFTLVRVGGIGSLFAMNRVVMLALVLSCSLTATGKGFLPETELTNNNLINKLEEIDPRKFTDQPKNNYGRDVELPNAPLTSEFEDYERELKELGVIPDESENIFTKFIEDSSGSGGKLLP